MQGRRPDRSDAAAPDPEEHRDASLLAHVATSKYVDALPLYRQAKIFERLGVDVSRTGRQLTSIGDAMGGILALALFDTDTANEAFRSAAANSGHAVLDDMCAPTSAYAAYYGALGTSALSAATATGLIAVEAATAIRVELHGTHGGRVLPHLQGIRGPGWGKTIWRFPPH